MPPPQQSNSQTNPPAGAAPKYAPPPSNLPLYQRVDPKTTTFFAKTHIETVQEQKALIFGIKRADRLRHMYAIGRSGSGKSKILEMIARQDIAYGYGVMVVDPIGDLTRDVLACVPKLRAKDVVLLDVTDSEYPFLWNPFRDVPEDLRHRYAQAMLEVFELQFGAGWSARIEHLLRFAFLALLDYPHATFGSIAPLLTEEDFRKEVSGYIRDVEVRQFWTQEFLVWEERFASEAVLPVVSKMRAILSDPTLSAMFGSGESRFRMSDVLEGERIVLVNLARVHLGSSDAQFLGALLMAVFSVVAMYEGAQGRRKRPFYLFADGVLDAITPVTETLLADARRNLVGAYFSHQYAGELSSSLRRFLLGNVGTMLVFRVMTEDATWLEPEFAPTLKAKDFALLPPRVCALKLTIDGNTQDPFLAESLTVHTLPGASPEEMRAVSRATYAKPRQEVERMMGDRQKDIVQVRESVRAMDGDVRIPLAPKPTEPQFVTEENTPTPQQNQRLSSGIPDVEGEATRDLRDE